MSEPQVKYIRHEDMYKPQSPLFATYPMVEYYHYSDAMEENARLKEEVERLRKAGEWQPIETAPKDGTVIWATNSIWKRPDYVKWGCIDHIDEWAWVHTHNRYNRTPEPVTHWMPIPKPPKEGKQS